MISSGNILKEAIRVSVPLVINKPELFILKSFCVLIILLLSPQLFLIPLKCLFPMRDQLKFFNTANFSISKGHIYILKF